MDDDVEEIGERMKVFRESLHLKQSEMAVRLGGSLPGYRKNEQGGSAPNSKLLAALYRQGANVNWLVSGEGPMLLADLAKQERINAAALAKAIEAMIRTAGPEETPAQTARKTVDFYMYMLDRGLITSEGVGQGDLGKVA